MAASNSVQNPIQGQAYRIYFRIDSSDTFNPITGGLTGLAGSLSKDGATFVASTNTPVEIGTSGYGYLDLTSAETAYYTVYVQVSATNANAIKFSKPVVFQYVPTTVTSLPTDLYGMVRLLLQFRVNTRLQYNQIFRLYQDGVLPADVDLNSTGNEILRQSAVFQDTEQVYGPAVFP